MLTWKTDWGPRDNWARAGVADAARLLSNAVALKTDLEGRFGCFCASVPPVWGGHETLPFADFLNKTEVLCRSLRVWPVPWEERYVYWRPAGPAPDYTDVNRWEKNGRETDRLRPLIQGAWHYSDELICGEV